MNPEMPKNFIEEMTDVFEIERNGTVVASAHGFFCGKEYPSTIQLVEDVSVSDGDWLVHSSTGHRYFVEDVQPIKPGRNVVSWMVKYQSEVEHDRFNRSAAQIQIGTVSGPSIIGNQQTATLYVGATTEDIAKLIAGKPAADLPELCELVTELKKIETTNEPVEKGRLAKFSDLLKKHSDILIALGGWAVKLLTGN